MRPQFLLLALIPILTAALAYTLSGGPDLHAQSTPAAQATCLQVLVFSRTQGFRHGSIDDGLDAIDALAATHNWEVSKTEDNTQFTPGYLGTFDVVVFLNTTGDVLDSAEETAFENYIAAGGGYVGVHAAADTEYDWTFYGDLMGAYFANHPAVQQADVLLEDDTHPATAHLPTTWTRTDEWYNFATNPRPNVNVALTLDESTYNGGTMGEDHPIAWYHEYGGGRAFYTAMGHTGSTYAEPDFRQHLRGAIEWAANGCDTPDPGPGDPPRIYPADNTLIDTASEWPRFTFEPKDGASWYNIWIGNDTTTAVFNWYEASQICASALCTLPDDLWLTNNTYSWWMSYWGETLPDYTTYWNDTTFSVDVPAPPLPANLSVADTSATNPQFTWDSSSNALWYHIILAPADFAWVYDMGWHTAESLTCADGCAYTNTALDGTLPADDYLLYVAAWGPGGMSTGGIANSGYTEGAFTYTP